MYAMDGIKINKNLKIVKIWSELMYSIDVVGGFVQTSVKLTIFCPINT